MNLLQQFIDHVKKSHLFSASDHLLLAVSGGIDSVVLSHLCKEANYPFSIAHCHFGLRGAESDRDAAFVKELAHKWEVECLVKHFDTTKYATHTKVSIQVAARELRYQWFAAVMAQDKKFLRLLTAHHADDHVETALMQFCKGTGITGLQGIPQKRGVVVRPLLFASRTDIEAYAKAEKLKWIEDSSNSETKYRRNHFRRVVLPAIETAVPGVRNNIIDTLGRLQEAQILYNEAVSWHKKKLMEFVGNELHIPVLKLQNTKPLHTLVFEMIKDYGFTPQQVPEVVKLLVSETGRYLMSPTHRILRNRKWLIISPLVLKDQSVVLVESIMDKIQVGEQTLEKVQKALGETVISNDPSMALLDARMIEYPLYLRKWKRGDYFYPLGMQKKKKLARFFIDQKLSLNEKESIWILESGKRIAWVVGHRIDDRFKITDTTKEVVQLRWSNL